ncbi:L-cysteine desulfidase family protein [Agathobaculum sp.]|uniref:L-cysteine desulfidase family protein n=1 Tax=Agathobaculum sp. TaxID=2048138 RepID=UPI002A8250B2|nr:L-serine ammonia-lyase, iron-sulfur-dependent, subunit alpha [Agathobaculum sp.]MDY3617886.1 L-serine ammonia-lyase, iron-sulfur-dependent, subunit alpha [Agathobaculum sp.]
METLTNQERFLKIMEKEMVPAVGCTEPIAVCYTAAVARKHAPDKVKKVRCRASVNIIKNVASVTIPGTHGRNGMKLACALGVAKPDVDRKLEILDGLTEEQLQTAVSLVEEGLVEVEMADVKCALYIEVEIETELHKVRTITQYAHVNTTLLEVDGKLEHTLNEGERTEQTDELYQALNLKTILDFSNTVPMKDLSIVQNAIKTNTAIAKDGLAREYGLQVGKTLSESVDKLMLSNDLATYAMMLASAGSDARMAGSSLPAYSNSGSGNQGITATMPVAAAAEKLNATEEQTVRACAISNLTAIFIKHKLGKLSSVCGAIVAATGAACGIVYLMGGKLPETVSAVKNMLGNVAGMFCDGAKASCALKVSTCANAAVQAAILAMNTHYIKGTDGIVGNTADETVANYCRILSEGVPELDKTLLDIIISKE